MLKEFKEFALKGNMIDLAIGVIIGGAFGGLVNSIVNDIFMPVIGLITGGIDFSNMFIQLAGEKQATLNAAKEAGATISYGNFITLLINFLIIAWVLFLFVKGINKIRRQQKEAENPTDMSLEEKLLTEIRDLLANKK
ncbi:large conductance mechanosensitive channel [Bartonella sp. CDC_skunk]|uniref:Large-conductance mechanosensitive channel n=1 Tax=Bartonella rochalimae ATCC BAA-1498 TaxID=685782 RepID=E6YKA5_9HYPH|nr:MULTISPECIES: large conductance mechanosensitive channel protein MscL [Bartonella]AQX17953.1 large conductance mechanosensitive channel [Bartonella sp. A1379B]AQX20875.1 large conductance mechanosensitive channel [Bartonella sp. CDC_skunk]AQX22466.1 large conductance mechanosensitive channel [Bartonella sp. 11B]AQX24253.1 large conductance mechanosensitive channel [Bartonella sp. 114]AQX24914.1 large conductance mechanosensitive channel [Bartonella sp. Coyote22sub2]